MFVEAAKLREKHGSKPYPTQELDILVQCAKKVIKDLQLFIRFVILLDGNHDTLNVATDSLPAHMLMTCAKDYLSRHGYEVSNIEVLYGREAEATEYQFSCFCFPSIKEEDVAYLMSNPLSQDRFSFKQKVLMKSFVTKKPLCQKARVKY